MIERRLRILHVAGARPNFIKIAPLLSAFRAYPNVEQILVHTGQHYDESLSKVFFDDLSIPRPDIDLEVRSGSHATQTARVMLAFEPVCLDWKPDLVIVVGDVNSTVACALVAAKLSIKIGHVEAGLRSFDWTMPEEINRVLTDRLSDLLFTTEESANENLRREGISADRIHFVGNVMIDTLLAHRDRALSLNVSKRFGLSPMSYALVTLHRPSNVDSAESLRVVVDGLTQIAAVAPVVFPVHPRTASKLDTFGLRQRLHDVVLLEPLGYLDFLGLMADAGVVLTDSGGVQEETTVLGVPCLTLRPNTERPVTITHGTNRLVRLDPMHIANAACEMIRNGNRAGDNRLPTLWDGSAAERIARITMQSILLP